MNSPKITQIHTLHDAGADRRAQHSKWKMIDAEAERIKDFIQTHPQIGVLQTSRGLVYYVNSPVYKESRFPENLV